MSQPTIPDITPQIKVSMKDSLKLILLSIAMQEMSLSQMLSAEAKKAKYLLKLLNHKNLSPHKLAEIKRLYQSIQDTVKELMNLEFLLKSKLETVKAFCKNHDEDPYPLPPDDDQDCVLDDDRCDPVWKKKRKRNKKRDCRRRYKVKRCRPKCSASAHGNLLNPIKINNQVLIINSAESNNIVKQPIHHRAPQTSDTIHKARNSKPLLLC